MKKVGKTITVKMIAADLRGAEPCSASGCPIARAMNRIQGGRWLVAGAHAVTMKGEALNVVFPRSAIEFQRAFDQLKDVKPITFTARLYPGISPNPKGVVKT